MFRSGQDLYQHTKEIVIVNSRWLSRKRFRWRKGSRTKTKAIVLATVETIEAGCFWHLEDLKSLAHLYASRGLGVLAKLDVPSSARKDQVKKTKIDQLLTCDPCCAQSHSSLGKLLVLATFSCLCRIQSDFWIGRRSNKTCLRVSAASLIASASIDTPSSSWRWTMASRRDLPPHVLKMSRLSYCNKGP